MAISDGQAPTFLHPNVTHLRHSGIEVGERTAHILIGMIKHNSDAMMDVPDPHDARRDGLRSPIARDRPSDARALTAPRST